MKTETQLINPIVLGASVLTLCFSFPLVPLQSKAAWVARFRACKSLPSPVWFHLNLESQWLRVKLTMRAPSVAA
jgi:hypothetical protein